jgi:hypothetical protein
MKARRSMIIGASIVAVAALGALLLARSVAAHHASGPFYDSSRKVEAQGPVTKFIFKNPHGFLYIDAPDATGKVVEWQIELGAPISLSRTGWTPDTLKVGTVIKAVGSPSRTEGSHGMCCARITRPDGSPIVAGGRVQEERQPPQ